MTTLKHWIMTPSHRITKLKHRITAVKHWILPCFILAVITLHNVDLPTLLNYSTRHWSHKYSKPTVWSGWMPWDIYIGPAAQWVGICVCARSREQRSTGTICLDASHWQYSILLSECCCKRGEIWPHGTYVKIVTWKDTCYAYFIISHYNSNMRLITTAHVSPKSSCTCQRLTVFCETKRNQMKKVTT